MDKKNFKSYRIKVTNANILIVDDNDINLQILSTILSYYGIKVTTAISGFDCLAIIKEAKIKFDLIFMDQIMPEMDGYETLRKIRKLPDTYCKKLPVIALSANDDKDAKKIFIEQGFSDYMRKPIDRNLLNNCLLKYISGDKVSMEEVDDINAYPIYTFQVKGIDTKLGLQYSNWDIDCYVNILKSVCKEAKECKQQINDFKEKKDWKRYAIIAHGLKGVAAGIGADYFSLRAKRHELAAQKKDIQFINCDFQEFVKDYDTLVYNIQSVIMREKWNEKPLTHINKTLQMVEVMEIIELIDNYDKDMALDKLHILKRYQLTTQQEQYIHEATELLEELEYEKASSILHSLLGEEENI
ncbi:CheY-like chemotaxis protein [Lachnotalea glycerini]|uniref:Stage 0 sporulation protein A homolog n=1 Tax=Lachnotalea glycerini TaxID=1763509 RepID=A0A318ET35_9FIRM|nr:response regulator [Lachnotalea glycerini]PXV96135.1 CheY-like chemotaxis protein [Lachnotalea glycerini]